MAEAARGAGRDPAELTTIVVTKFHPVELIRELHSLGIRNFGESRHQEASQKALELADLSLSWHFVGQLQSKKARAVAGYADVIHSVDRESVVSALEHPARSISAFIQLNLTDNPARGGAPVDAVERFAEEILVRTDLRLLGVMAVAPLGEEPRRAFARLRQYSLRLQTVAPRARAISAGMSDDFAAAIAEGATHLRIGTAITGNRPARG